MDGTLYELKLRTADKAVVSVARCRIQAQSVVTRLAHAAKLQVGDTKSPLRDHQKRALVSYLQGQPTDEFHPPLAQLDAYELPRYVTFEGTMYALVLSDQDAAELRNVCQRTLKAGATVNIAGSID